jgi:hypothetical protein
MEKTYAGNTPELIELYLENQPIQWLSKGKGWVDIPPYEKPSDIYRVSNKNYTFRLKPEKVITKAYMHYDDIEKLVQKGDFNQTHINQYLFSSNYAMNKHLEMTFTNGKLTKVEMKDATD